MKYLYELIIYEKGNIFLSPNFKVVIKLFYKLEVRVELKAKFDLWIVTLNILGYTPLKLVN